MTRKFTVLDTQGQAVQVDTDVQYWKDLAALLEGQGVSFANKKATISGVNLTLDHPDAVLPSKNSVIVLSPVKFKANACDTDSFYPDYEIDEVANLGYRDLKDELKQLRIAAVQNECEEVVELIGNYTRSSTEEMQKTLTKVYEFLNTASDSAHEVAVDIAAFEQRLLAIELELKIRNQWNAGAFDKHFLNQ